MFNYPKVLRPKDLKKISKHSCDDEIKDAYVKYLTNYSFKEFVAYCSDNDGMDLEDLIFKFTDLQLERFEPNSLIWISHVMVNFMIYVDVNLDYGEYYDAYASALQLSVLSFAMEMSLKKIPFDEVSLPQNCRDSFKNLFIKVPDFRFNLEKDCHLAYNSYNTGFDFSDEEFYLKIKKYFDEKGYQ